MSDFDDDMNEDLEQCFFDPEEFGESCESDGVKEGIRYIPSNGAPPRIITALFDTPSSSASTEATEDVNANMPHLTTRQCDMEGGTVRSGDRFVRAGIEYRPVLYDGSNGQGVCRFFLHEV